MFGAIKEDEVIGFAQSTAQGTNNVSGGKSIDRMREKDRGRGDEGIHRQIIAVFRSMFTSVQLLWK